MGRIPRSGCYFDMLVSLESEPCATPKTAGAPVLLSRLASHVRWHSGPEGSLRFGQHSALRPINYFEPSKLLEACAEKEGMKA